MDATTLASVKDWLNETSTGLDIQLNQLIPAISQALERPDLLNRPLLQTALVEEYDFPRSRNKRITLRAAPVLTSPAPILKESYKKDWAGVNALVTTDYNLWTGPDEAYIKFHSPIFGPTVLQVQYTGGMATTTAAFMTAYPLISQAANIWIAEIYSRRKSIGKSIQSYPNRGGTTTFELGDPPKIVRNLLKAYARRSLVA